MVKLWQKYPTRGLFTSSSATPFCLYIYFEHLKRDHMSLFEAIWFRWCVGRWSVGGRKICTLSVPKCSFYLILESKAYQSCWKNSGPNPRGVLFLVNLVLLVSRLHNPTWWHVTENDQFSDLITLIWWFCWILWFWWWWLSVGSWSSIVWNYTFVKICWYYKRIFMNDFNEMLGDVMRKPLSGRLGS